MLYTYLYLVNYVSCLFIFTYEEEIEGAGCIDCYLTDCYNHGLSLLTTDTSLGQLLTEWFFDLVRRFGSYTYTGVLPNPLLTAASSVKFIRWRQIIE